MAWPRIFARQRVQVWTCAVALLAVFAGFCQRAANDTSAAYDEPGHMLAGFSGHGLMHAPGCGLAMAELILKGRYETLDLTRFGWKRVAEGAPLPERGII